MVYMGNALREFAYEVAKIAVGTFLGGVMLIGSLSVLIWILNTARAAGILD
jgi:hypothetical protein